MKKLLAIEWLKIKDYNAFKVIGILFILGVFLANYIVYSVNKNIVGEMGQAGKMISFKPYDFVNTWQTTSYVTGYILIIPALLLIILITNEFSFRTSRQNIIDGWSRNQFIHVKLMQAFLIAVASTILVMITGFLFGLFSGTAISFSRFSSIVFFFLKAFTYNTLAVFISVWVRKTGFAIGLYFIYLGAENIISQLLDILSIKLKKDGVGDFGNLGDLLPMNASDGLLAFPDNPVKSMAKMVLPSENTSLVFVFALMYLALFIWGSRMLFIKKNL
ncbi:MAG: hypothetical protein ABS68_12670 [Niastella sp. SCN 39-18]|nr:hypothetical protein [Sphingobacteriales bacterium]ODT51522.1 MAG: hypothetical protein ABS68_12670 [Niastella sp. SCN 39-18]OJW09173.1 MAG: hypothetical protein BGO53_00520 [Sphingobacteriales bacterium 39-19]